MTGFVDNIAQSTPVAATDHILIATAGGTIDKSYFDKKSQYQVGAPVAPFIAEAAKARCSVSFLELMRKDSLDMTITDRREIVDRLSSRPEKRIVITHGTDTMTQTAQVVSALKNRTIVLTGSLEPARFKESDAAFNLGLSIGAVQLLKHGVYVAMNGRVFEFDKVRKDTALNEFVDL